MPRKIKGPSQRQLRVGEMVRHALTALLQRGEVQDETLQSTLVSVSEVSMSPDLKIATAYVTALGGGNSETIVKALASNGKFIRGRLARELHQMKYMPQFRFRADTSFDNYSKIDSLLRKPEVSRDLDQNDDV